MSTPGLVRPPRASGCPHRARPIVSACARVPQKICMSGTSLPGRSSRRALRRFARTRPRVPLDLGTSPRRSPLQGTTQRAPELDGADHRAPAAPGALARRSPRPVGSTRSSALRRKDRSAPDPEAATRPRPAAAAPLRPGGAASPASWSPTARPMTAPPFCPSARPNVGAGARRLVAWLGQRMSCFRSPPRAGGRSGRSREPLRKDWFAPRFLCASAKIPAMRRSHPPRLQILHVDAKGAGELGHSVERARLLAGLDLAE